MTPKQKKFAALAPPRNKITHADKIAGATKAKRGKTKIKRPLTKVIKGLNKASKLHAGQAKTLKKVLNDQKKYKTGPKGRNGKKA